MLIDKFLKCNEDKVLEQEVGTAIGYRVSTVNGQVKITLPKVPTGSDENGEDETQLVHFLLTPDESGENKLILKTDQTNKMHIPGQGYVSEANTTIKGNFITFQSSGSEFWECLSVHGDWE